MNRSLILLTVGTLALAGCADESDREPNPGLGFNGIYSVDIVVTAGDGKPVDPATADRQHYEWRVQSVCESSERPCTAIASGTTPDDATMNLDRMDYVI